MTLPGQPHQLSYGTALTPQALTAVLSLASTHTPGVPISFKFPRLSVPAGYVSGSPSMDALCMLVRSLVAALSRAERPCCFSPPFVGAILPVAQGGKPARYYFENSSIVENSKHLQPPGISSTHPCSRCFLSLPPAPSRGYLGKRRHQVILSVNVSV